MSPMEGGRTYRFVNRRTKGVLPYIVQAVLGC